MAKLLLFTIVLYGKLLRITRKIEAYP